jgi:hypothetical protein
VERLRIKVRKALWLTLSAAPGQEKRALAMLLGRLAIERQTAHIMKTLVYKIGPAGGEEGRREDGGVACTARFTWSRSTTNEKCMEVCDWLAPIVFQASREGTLAALREALGNSDDL